MRDLRIWAVVVSVGFLTALGLTNAKADTSDWDTFMTFSAPVEVPGMVLPAGKYEFRILDRTGSGYLVGILDSNGHYLEAVQAEPDYRLKLTDKTVVRLENRDPGSPEAVVSWFYPGENYGVVFVYPNSKPAEAAPPAK